LNNLQRFSKSTKKNISKEPSNEKTKTPRKKSNYPKLVEDTTKPKNPTTNEVMFEPNNNLDQFNEVLNMIEKSKVDEVSPTISAAGNNL
jgi:hypothetical protein